MELSKRIWQRNGEFVPVQNLNLWFLLLLISLPLLTAPKGKILLQERGGKEKRQKQKAEECREESSLQEADLLEHTQGCW